MRILSGIQPSGMLHIGNYLGMIKPMIEYQEKGELFCFIADLHSMTTVNDPETLKQNTESALVDLLALGIDPEKSMLWVQSDVPEVTELSWYLSCIAPLGLLQRCHSYKDKVAKGITPSAGLFTYPLLMAADILLYSSDIVPVGRDQKQHVEVTRDIALKFNMKYGEVFNIPEPKIQERVAVVPGVDGNKMSKSYDNAIEIFASDKTLKKKVMSIVTDSAPLEEPKDPDKNNVYNIYKLFASESEASEMAEKLRAGGYGYGHAKKELLNTLKEMFSKARKERERIINDKGYIAEVRKKGAEKARSIGSPLLSAVRNSVGALGRG